MHVVSSERATHGRWVAFALWASFVPLAGLNLLITVGLDVVGPLWSAGIWLALLAAWLFLISRLSVSMGYVVMRRIDLSNGAQHRVDVDFYPMAYAVFGKYVVKYDGLELATKRSHLRSLDRVEFQFGEAPPHQAVLIVKLATDVRWKPLRLRYSWHPMLNLEVDGEVIGEV